MFDINPSNKPLVERWKKNREFRESGMERFLAKAVLGINWEKRYQLLLEGKCPLAFEDAEIWNIFQDELVEALQTSGTTGHIGLRGTAATFVSMNPNKGCNPDLVTAGQKEDNINIEDWKKKIHYFDAKVVQAGGPKAVEGFNEYKLFEIYSDLDFNIKSDGIVSIMKKRGAVPSPQTVGNNYGQDDTMDVVPALWEVKAKWAEALKRDITFVTASII